MRKLQIFLLAISAFGCRSLQEQQAQIVFDRVAYVYNLKAIIAKDIWPRFDESQYDVPLIYYTDTSSFIANPTEQFLKTYHPKLVYQNSNIRIYKASERIDSIPFHMAVGFTTGDTTAYDNYSPFMRCSSFEETRKVMQDVSSTEEWVTMIIHEYFHGFQYNHENYLYAFAQNVSSVSQDSLRHIYKNNPWFKEKVDKENQLLLLALGAGTITETDSIATEFFLLRQQRRNESKQKLGLDIEKYEKAYETIEGTARYVEQKLYEKFSNKTPDIRIASSDTSYHSYSYFKNYKLDKNEWMYLTSKSGLYYYATGFNIIRLLDKLNIEYKARLFREENLTLEEILEAS